MWIVLMKGVAKDGLYKLLNLPLNHSQVKSILLSSVSYSNLLSVCKINKPESMMSVVSKEHCTSCKDQRINKTLDCWHMRLGHPNASDLRKTLSACNITFGNKIFELSFCKACQYGKMHRLSFKSSESKSSTALEIIHSDLWGPAPTFSNQGFKYYIVFIDDKINYTWIYGLAHKSQAPSAFITFKNQIEKSFELKIKTIQCDMKGEYRAFEPYLRNEGIAIRYFCPYTHHQNGKAKRKYRHLVETGLTLLTQADIPLKF